MPVEQVETIMRAPAAALDTLARAVWQDHAAGRLADAEAQQLAEAIEARRRALRRPEKGPAVLRVAVTREETRTAVSEAPRPTPGLRRNGPRQLVLQIPRPATYDRTRSLERRRSLAASGPMPPQLAASFTTGELAVLRIIADEVHEHGQCDRTLGELAARAGVCRTTAKNTVRHAARLGFLAVEERRQVGRKSLPNVIRIVSREWRAWLERRSDRPARIRGKNLSTTDKRVGCTRILKRRDASPQGPATSLQAPRSGGPLLSSSAQP